MEYKASYFDMVAEDADGATGVGIGEAIRWRAKTQGLMMNFEMGQGDVRWGLSG